MMFRVFLPFRGERQFEDVNRAKKLHREGFVVEFFDGQNWEVWVP